MADDLPSLQCRNVKKIRGLNLPGTPWATSACCGRQKKSIFYCLDGPSDFCITSKDLTAMLRGWVLTFLQDFSVYTKQAGGHCANNSKKCFFSQTYFLRRIHEYLCQSNYCRSHCDTNNANQACLEIKRVQSGARGQQDMTRQQERRSQRKNCVNRQCASDA